mmetsp:Transcript_5556/g.34403  ORF Transcript_5556/g.34403 Transcript_5556/m.34403 type:complete len:117 (+) Transcript_5556:575-925(+)
MNTARSLFTNQVFRVGSTKVPFSQLSMIQPGASLQLAARMVECVCIVQNPPNVLQTGLDIQAQFAVLLGAQMAPFLLPAQMMEPREFGRQATSQRCSVVEVEPPLITWTWVTWQLT